MDGLSELAPLTARQAIAAVIQERLHQLLVCLQAVLDHLLDEANAFLTNTRQLLINILSSTE